MLRSFVVTSFVASSAGAVRLGSQQPIDGTPVHLAGIDIGGGLDIGGERWESADDLRNAVHRYLGTGYFKLFVGAEELTDEMFHGTPLDVTLVRLRPFVRVETPQGKSVELTDLAAPTTAALLAAVNRHSEDLGIRWATIDWAFDGGGMAINLATEGGPLYPGNELPLPPKDGSPLVVELRFV